MGTKSTSHVGVNWAQLRVSCSLFCKADESTSWLSPLVECFGHSLYARGRIRLFKLSLNYVHLIIHWLFCPSTWWEHSLQWMRKRGEGQVSGEVEGQAGQGQGQDRAQAQEPRGSSQDAPEGGQCEWRRSWQEEIELSGTSRPEGKQRLGEGCLLSCEPQAETVHFGSWPLLFSSRGAQGY